jgi:deazaflavin-dependent oxidoreductase (nitroreductase family)
VRVTLSLITRGRRSGQPREVVLYAFADGDRWVVVGSRGGSPIDPRWADNLRAERRASIRVGEEIRPVRGREAEGEERERLWALVCEDYPTYSYFQSRTKRLIPIFVLEPAGEPQ